MIYYVIAVILYPIFFSLLCYVILYNKAQYYDSVVKLDNEEIILVVIAASALSALWPLVIIFTIAFFMAKKLASKIANIVNKKKGVKK